MSNFYNEKFYTKEDLADLNCIEELGGAELKRLQQIINDGGDMHESPETAQHAYNRMMEKIHREMDDVHKQAEARKQTMTENNGSLMKYFLSK